MGAAPALALLSGVRWRGVDVPGERSGDLLAALALAAPRAVPAERLVAEVWAEPPDHPDKALQVLVSRTRARTAAAVVERVPHGYRLGLAEDEVDLLRLGTLVRQGQASRSPDPLLEALAVPVTGSADDSARGRVLAEAHRQRATARRVLGAVLLGRGEAVEALPLLEEALAAQAGPLPDESLLADVLRAEAQVRGVPAALDRYAAHADRVRHTVGAEPGPELRRLHADLLARDAPVREGLAYDATPLVGRDHDLTELRGLLAGSRVVSIVGAGGLGKTRMAHLTGRTSDHPVVHFVGLAGVATPEGVLPEIASALGVRDTLTGLGKQRGSRPGELRGRIAEQLSGPRTLLILDNCEHVLDAAADLVAFLVAITADLQVLTTSRAPLGVAAEQVYQLPQLDAEAAVELFAQRARAARPDVAPDPDEVRDLVARLDGLPLAIELAAAKVRVMSVPEITRRLTDRFALLRGADRTAPERHRTLLAVIDWSWNLLAEADRRALRWLAVFPDGFGLAGAAAVLGHDPLEEVTGLVEQSLLVVQHGAAGGPSRYRMLETVREYAGMQLTGSGEDVAAAEALRGWALDLARRESALIQSADQVAAVGRLAAEEGNLAALLRRSIEAADVTTVLVLGAALTGVWSIRGDHLTVVETAQEAEDLVVGAPETPEVAIELRAMLALIAMNQLIFTARGDGRAHARLRELGPGDTSPRLQGMIRVLLTIDGAVGGEDPGSPARPALRRLCDDDDPAVALVACQFMSQALENAGDLAGAREMLERGLALARPDDGPWARAQLHAMMAGLAGQSGQVDLAEEHAREALPVMQELGATEDSIQLYSTLVMAQLARGELDEAERSVAAAERLDRRRETVSWRLISALSRAELTLARGDAASGLALYREAVEANRESRRPWLSDVEEVAPWLLFTQSASLCAHVIHDEYGQERTAAMAGELRAKVPAVLSARTLRLDFPVAGGVLFALGCWALAACRDEADREAGVRLLLLARAFGYQQTMPSMRWQTGERLAERHAPGRLDALGTSYAGRAPYELCDEAAAVTARLAP